MKKLTKRKMYQKRRKKEKLEQRKKVTQSKLPGGTTTSGYKQKNSNCTKKRFEPNPTINSYQQKFALNPTTSYSQSLQLWWQTYCSAIEFHARQQNSWHVNSQQNHMLLLEKYANEYETSSEDDDYDENIIDETIENGDGYVDDEYIKFLEITRKHQEEMGLKRAEYNT